MAESLGCVVAEDVTAVVSIPAAAVAAFEGIAVRSADISAAAQAPVMLALIDPKTHLDVRAGTARIVHAGEVLPVGADAVLPAGNWRDMRGIDEAAPVAVQVESASLPGFGVWPAGHDCEIGETVVPAGTNIGPGTIALLVAAGVTRLRVIPKPRCVIVAVSDEKTADPVLGLMSAVVTAAGGHAYAVGPVRCDDALADVIEDQLVRADLMIICGDWSTNPDPVMAVLGTLGEAERVNVALEPAGRTCLARIGSGATADSYPIVDSDSRQMTKTGNGQGATASVPVLVVPTDPWAAYVSFDAFALPLLRELRGQSGLQRAAVIAESTADVAAVADRQRYLLGRVTQEGDESRVQPLHPSRAGLLNIANCIVILDPQMELRAGRPCSVFLLPGTL